jgi:hypothetical protein
MTVGDFVKRQLICKSFRELNLFLKMHKNLNCKPFAGITISSRREAEK